jgi:hypothetical protein
MSKEAMQMALEALEDANDVARMEFSDEDYYSEAINALRQVLVDADDTSQERVDEMVKIEHDKQVTIAQAYERGWNAALAQQEPVAWRTFDGEGGYDYRSYEMNETYDKEWAERNPNHKGWVEPLYTAPPKAAEWVGLTEDECIGLIPAMPYDFEIDVEVLLEYTKNVEAKLKERNG